jgi:hypothetical protein
MITKERSQQLQDTLSGLVGLPCWQISAGKGVGASFLLNLGRKIPLPKPVRNIAFVGEASLLVWCNWRLDGASAPITSSDEDDEIIAQKLDVLIGQRITSAAITSKAWDMCLTFSNGLELRVFCDHVPGDPSFDGNWQLRVGNIGVSAGPGYDLKIEERAEEFP